MKNLDFTRIKLTAREAARYRDELNDDFNYYGLALDRCTSVSDFITLCSFHWLFIEYVRRHPKINRYTGFHRQTIIEEALREL